jgi:hypothetical protein
MAGRPLLLHFPLPPPSYRLSAAGGGQAAAKTGSHLASQLPIFFQILPQCYQDVVNPSKVLPASSHGVVHHLRMTGPPIALPFQWLNAEKLVAAMADFMKMEAEGIIRQSSNPWASPLNLVKKLDGSWRPCRDFFHLNLALFSKKAQPRSSIQLSIGSCWLAVLAFAISDICWKFQANSCGRTG